MKRVQPSIIDQMQEQKQEKRQNIRSTKERREFSVRFDGYSTRNDSLSLTPYVVYTISVKKNRVTWVIFKRYSDFTKLLIDLKAVTDIPLQPLPPKKIFGNLSKEFVEDRKNSLQIWLNEMLKCDNIVVCQAIARFLSNESNLDIVDKFSKVGLNKAKEVTLDDFQQLTVLGKGSFGKVILCRKKDSGELFADKVIKKKKVAKGKQYQHTKTERRVLGYINHPFLVKLHFAFQTVDKLHFILDFVPGGELFFHLGRFGRFSERLSKFYAAEIALALGYLHENKIIYRDLKPENILLQSDGHIKLADFGLSKEQEEERISFSFCGTPEYLAPEVINKSGHDGAVDWWSLGSLLYEMLTGLPPWYCENRRELFRHIRYSSLTFPNHLSPEAKDILKGLLQKEREQRLGTVQDVASIKAHEFFKDIDFEKLLKKEIEPPFKPKVDTTCESKPDTKNFDAEFTKMSIESKGSPVGLSVMDEQLFRGFTYRDQPIGMGITSTSSHEDFSPQDMPKIERKDEDEEDILH